MKNDNVKIQKEKFLEDEIETFSIFAAFGRARIYLQTADQHGENELKKFIGGGAKGIRQ